MLRAIGSLAVAGFLWAAGCGSEGNCPTCGPTPLRSGSYAYDGHSYAIGAGTRFPHAAAGGSPSIEVDVGARVAIVRYRSGTREVVERWAIESLSDCR